MKANNLFLIFPRGNLECLRFLYTFTFPSAFLSRAWRSTGLLLRQQQAHGEREKASGESVSEREKARRTNTVVWCVYTKPTTFKFPFQNMAHTHVHPRSVCKYVSLFALYPFPRRDWWWNEIKYGLKPEEWIGCLSPLNSLSVPSLLYFLIYDKLVYMFQLVLNKTQLKRYPPVIK